ncbi:nitrate- and nitrite sensing domain-containing protein [Pannonibacter sp. Pt2-lr]
MMAVVPLLAVVLYAGNYLWGEFIYLRKMQQMKPLVEVSGLIEAVVDELQKERGQTAVLIASGYDQAAAAAVGKQRSATDADLQALQVFLTNFAGSRGMLLPGSAPWQICRAALPATVPQSMPARSMARTISRLTRG